MSNDNAEADRNRAVAATRADRDRTLEAVHRLETSLATAARSEGWLPEVTAELAGLHAAMHEERNEMERPDALLAMILAEHPRRFGPRVRSLHRQYDDILRQVALLRSQLLERSDDELDAGDLRQRCGWLTTALRHCRALQTDLVYEALDLDLGETPQE